MKAGQILLGLVVVVVLGALVIGGCAMQGYNQVIKLDEEVKNEWSQVETQLQRRYDLLPNEQAIVKGYSEQEQKIFLGVAEARKTWFNAQQGAKSVNERVAAANQAESALARLLVFSENYPQLKSNENFLKFQDDLSGTENRISVARGRYNDAVRDLNSYIRRFPGQIWAGFAGVTAAEHFKVAEEAKNAPKINFGDNKEKVKEPGSGVGGQGAGETKD